MAAKKTKAARAVPVAALAAPVRKALATASAHADTSALEEMLLAAIDFGDWDDAVVVRGTRDRGGRVHAEHPVVDEGTLWLLPVLAAYASEHVAMLDEDGPLRLAGLIERGRADAQLDLPAPLKSAYVAARAKLKREAVARLSSMKHASDERFMQRASILADLMGCPDAGRACATPALSKAKPATADGAEIVARTAIKSVHGFDHVVSFTSEGKGNVIRFKLGDESDLRTKVVATFDHTRDVRFVYALDTDGNVVRRRPGGATGRK